MNRAEREARNAAIIAAYRGGASMADAARPYGLTASAVSLILKKAGQSPCKAEVRARHAAAMADPEVRARHAAAMADPEVRARHAAAVKRAMADPEVRARHAAAVKRAMADPEVRARHAAAMADPEVRARKSAAMKRAMADPEVRARKSAAMKRRWQSKLSWCPPELIDDYRLLVRHIGAAAARKAIENQLCRKTKALPAPEGEG
jgi:hypothetical protein